MARQHRHRSALVIALALTLGCAASTTHRLALVTNEIAHATVRLQQVEMDLYTQGYVSKSDHVEVWGAAFAKIADSGSAAVAALRAGDQQTSTTQLVAVLDLLTALERDAVVKLGPTERNIMRIAIATARAVFMALGVS